MIKRAAISSVKETQALGTSGILERTASRQRKGRNAARLVGLASLGNGRSEANGSSGGRKSVEQL